MLLWYKLMVSIFWCTLASDWVDSSLHYLNKNTTKQILLCQCMINKHYENGSCYTKCSVAIQSGYLENWGAAKWVPGKLDLNGYKRKQILNIHVASVTSKQASMFLSAYLSVCQAVCHTCTYTVCRCHCSYLLKFQCTFHSWCTLEHLCRWSCDPEIL